jgi:hypothetical protein
MKKIVFFIYFVIQFQNLQAQNKDFQKSIDSLTISAADSWEMVTYPFIDSLVRNHSVNEVITGINGSIKKHNSLSKGRVANFYFDMLRIKVRNSTNINERQLVVNEILKMVQDTSKNNFICRLATYTLMMSFNREDFDSIAKQKLVKHLYGNRYYDVLQLIGMLDIITEKKKVIELRNNEKDNDILFKLNLALARWGEEKAMTFFIKKMKENQKENKFYENYSYSIYIANPMVIKFLINEIDSSYEIQLSADDEPVPVGFASADVLEKLIIKFPKALTVEERNLKFYKLWLNKNKNNFKIDRDAVWKYK